MPIIQVQMLSGRSFERKEKLIAEITRVVSEVLDISAERVRVVITDIPPEHWGIAGQSVAKQRRDRSGE